MTVILREQGQHGRTGCYTCSDPAFATTELLQLLFLLASQVCTAALRQAACFQHLA